MFMMHFTGVSFKDWKAKEGECEDKCERAAGPFSIVRECEPDAGFSCDGLKEPTEETEDCAKYCSSTGRMKQFYIIQTNPTVLETANEVPLRGLCHCKFLYSCYSFIK